MLKWSKIIFFEILRKEFLVDFFKTNSRFFLLPHQSNDFTLLKKLSLTSKTGSFQRRFRDETHY